MADTTMPHAIPSPFESPSVRLVVLLPLLLCTGLALEPGESTMHHRSDSQHPAPPLPDLPPLSPTITPLQSSPAPPPLAAMPSKPVVRVIVRLKIASLPDVHTEGERLRQAI